MSVAYFLNGQIGAVVGPAVDTSSGMGGTRTYVAKVVGTGAVVATVQLDGSHDGLEWFPITTFNLTGTNSASGTFASPNIWPTIRATLSAPTAGAKVSCSMAY